MKCFRYIVALLACLPVAARAAAPTAEQKTSALRPWAENPWYWSFQGKPILLLGGSDDDNLFQWLEKDLVAQLDRLAEAGGNVIRNTMSDRKDKGFDPKEYSDMRTMFESKDLDAVSVATPNHWHALTGVYVRTHDGRLCGRNGLARRRRNGKRPQHLE